MPYVTLPILGQNNAVFNMRAFRHADGTHSMVQDEVVSRPALSAGSQNLPVAKGALPAPPSGATQLTVQVQGGVIRYCETSGTTASSAVGKIASDLSEIVLSAGEEQTFSAAAMSGTPNLWVVWS